jgi:hypothetical protein
MGKAANNERYKIIATRYNNIAVGCFLSGFIIPYIGMILNPSINLDIPFFHSRFFYSLILVFTFGIIAYWHFGRMAERMTRHIKN